MWSTINLSFYYELTKELIQSSYGSALSHFHKHARHFGRKGLIAADALLLADVWDWEAKRGNEKINTAF